MTTNEIEKKLSELDTRIDVMEYQIEQEVVRLMDAVQTFSETLEGIMSEHFERVSKKLFNHEIDLLKEQVLGLMAEKNSLKNFIVKELMEIKKELQKEGKL